LVQNMQEIKEQAPVAHFSCPLREVGSRKGEAAPEDRDTNLKI
jgi:hypothetical protein